MLRTLDRLRPVRVAVETSVRLWNGRARAELLEGAVRASTREEPALFALLHKCTEALHVDAPALHVAPKLADAAAHTFGTDADAYLLVDRTLFAGLTELERMHLIGRELARIQNEHVTYATALYYLEHYANRFVRWVVLPASRALGAWARRAEITLDRAGLLCARNVDASESAIRKTARDERQAEARVQALRLFADSAYYKGVVGETGGLSASECDSKVAEVL